MVVVKGLGSQPVPGAKQLVLFAVPEGKAPHAIEMVQAVLAPLAVGMEQDLGIAVRPKAMPQRLQLRPQLQIVIELPIIGEREIPLWQGHGLVAGGTEIQNAQPPVPQSQKGSAASLLQRGQRELGQRVLSPVKGRALFADQRIAFIIRAPMADHIRHAAQRVRIHAPVQIQITTDPTHTRSPLFQRKSAPTPEQEPLFPVGR